MATVQQPQSLALEPPDCEAENHVKLCMGLEALTTMGDPGQQVQITADELFGVFHALRLSAERVQESILAG